MVKLKTLKSLPIEFYEIKWTTFARENKIPKYISEKSVLIDSSNYRYQNGSDVYISRIIKDILEPEDITAITQAYRNMVDEFADNNAIAVINNKISEASTIMNGNISLSADHGNKGSWEASLVTQIDGIPFANVGKGAQCIVKTQLALNHRKAENAGVILLEEPESHLSFSRLSMLMDSMNTVTNEKQIIISTHSSFVANKLGLENLIFLANNNCLSMKNLSEDTFKFFKKLAGYDTLRLILCKKAILVEGDSDELIVQRAYMDNHNGKLPIHDGIDVITMRGLTFKRFLEISKSLKKVTAVVSDNDGDFDAVVNKYREYENETYIKICIDNEIDTGGLENFNYNTLEPKLLKENNVELFNEIFKTSYDSDEEMLNYMHSRKSECALAIFESDHSIKYPEYILKAVRDE